LNGCKRIDETPWLGPIKLEWDYKNKKAPFLGMFGLPVKIEEKKIGAYLEL
jgi:lipopolysaccharide transport system ATP-binding protein